MIEKNKITTHILGITAHILGITALIVCQIVMPVVVFVFYIFLALILSGYDEKTFALVLIFLIALIPGYSFFLFINNRKVFALYMFAMAVISINSIYIVDFFIKTVGQQ